LERCEGGSLRAFGAALGRLAARPGPAARPVGARAARLRPRLAAALVAAAAVCAGAAEASPRLRPLDPGAAERRCTADGAFCIAAEDYVGDVCRTIEGVAQKHGLDPHFFFRLIWRESLFDAAAVSPKGAQGIAQFMPETGKLRGLRDAFNPAEALYVSARYLAELSGGFGNIGLAAVAYNGGEARAARFLAREGGLPLETRDYVQAITGLPAEAWRDAPPDGVDLALGQGEFKAACVAHAGTMRVRQFATGPVLKPWGVVIASNRQRAGAERQVSRLMNRHARVLRGEAVAYIDQRRPGMRARMVYAQVGRDSRSEADAFCGRLRASGLDCMVLRN
jgi:hypothetical protein